ncbi:spermidine/putrescine ABC transporter permease PotC [Rhodobacterales bacterium 52_120_T64]|nr:spermidine/putrescine ABC transporter permease PotC [Rhodobacterales bacterium 52_120_T64]
MRTFSSKRIGKSKVIEPLAYTKRSVIKLVIFVNLLFLYLPLLVLIAFSFNDSKRNIVWRGFTFKYYEKTLKNDQLMEALTNSLQVALLATFFATILGTMLGLALQRFRFPGKGPVDAWAHMPIMIPEVCMGVSLLAFFALVKIPLGLFTITASHIAFCIPFVAIVVRARAATIDPAMEEASYDLGASRIMTFWRITLPQLAPGIIAGALLAFTVSLDDFVITFFTGGPGSTTFPIQVYSMIKFSVTPEINAASTMLIVLTSIVIAVGLVLHAKTSEKDSEL